MLLAVRAVLSFFFFSREGNSLPAFRYWDGVSDITYADTLIFLVSKVIELSLVISSAASHCCAIKLIGM